MPSMEHLVGVQEMYRGKIVHCGVSAEVVDKLALAAREKFLSLNPRELRDGIWFGESDAEILDFEGGGICGWATYDLARVQDITDPITLGLVYELGRRVADVVFAEQGLSY